MAATPRFRTDLVATPLEIEGKRFIDVTDPDSEQTFRFYEVEYSVACAMDGARDIDGLMEWSKQELGLEPSLDELEMVVSTLDDLGYLDVAGSGDIELGTAGPPESQRAQAVHADDIALGGSGASPIAPPRPNSPAEAAAVELGMPGKQSPPPAGKVTMGWDAPPVDPKELEELMGRDSLGPAGLAAKAANAGKQSLPPAGKVTMGWDAPPVDPKELEELMGRSSPAEAIPTLKRRIKPDDEEDGPTVIPAAIPDYDDEDLSVDLSDHLSIGTEDVKEAVRQSKTMDAVEVPADLLAELEDQPTKSGRALEEAAEPEPAVLKRDKAAPKPAAVDPSVPIALPSKPPKISKDEPRVAAAAEETPIPAAKGGGGGALILFLLLVIIGGGAGAYYFLVYKKQDDGAKKPTPGQTVGPGASKTAGRGQAVISSKLAESDPDVVEVSAIADGVIASISVAGDEVDEGAVVASLKGVAGVERRLERPRRKLAEYAATLEKAKAAGAKAKTIERYQAKVDEKKQLVIAGMAELEALQMHAPSAGKVEPIVDAGANVKKGEPVAQIIGEAGLSATFPTKKKFEVGGACEIAPAKDPTKVVPCKVDSIEPDKVTIRISKDVGFASGDAVVLR